MFIVPYPRGPKQAKLQKLCSAAHVGFGSTLRVSIPDFCERVLIDAHHMTRLGKCASCDI